jgi:hypothetical protein
VRFEEVVQAWLELEERYGFVLGSSALKSQYRPVEVKDWIGDGRGRNMAVRPISDIGIFEEGWWKWWTGLQPTWRGIWKGRAGTPPPEDGSWEKLVMPGQNRMLSVVATLYWWGYAEKERGLVETSAGWEEAAKDVLSVLRELKDHKK